VSDKHEFLSDSWFEAVGTKIAELGGTAAHGPNVVMNLVVTGTSFGDREFHMGARDGETMFARGHRDDADLTMTTDADTAKEVFVAGNPQAGMQAFMQGKVKVQGDMAKLMAAQAGGGGPANPELQQAIQSLTA
jgi:putative sterol carrier protein